MHACAIDWASRLIDAMTTARAIERNSISLLFEELTRGFTGAYHGVYVPIFFHRLSNKHGSDKQKGPKSPTWGSPPEPVSGLRLFSRLATHNNTKTSKRMRKYF